MSEHLSIDDLAVLAERGGADLTAVQRDHLASCWLCRDAIEEARRASREFASAPHASSASARAVTEILSRTSERRPPRRTRWWPAAVGVPVAAALALLILAPQPERHALSDEMVAPIHTVLANRDIGAMVYPGVNAGVEQEPSRLGAGQGDRVAASVRTLAARQRQHPDDPRITRWLVAGYLALDDLPGARTFVEDGLRRHPDDARLLAAAGLVAYRSGAFADARELLQAAHVAGGDQREIMFNLAVLELEVGSRDDAVVMLQRLSDQGDDLLTTRAAALLARHRPTE
jgi:hypothetical protein